jgi:hypothetical protein
MGLAPGQVGDEPDAASVVLVLAVVQPGALCRVA